ncbi:MAG: cell envelope integrity EipB family protein [Alphaproteobacteria bacterium]
METGRSKMVLGAAVLLAALSLDPLPAAPAVAVDLIPHRAFYALSLKSTIPGSSLTDARGAMFLEWSDSCEGYSSSQRLQLRFFDASLPTVEVDSRFASWESRDGLSYRFNVISLRNGVAEREVTGQASLDGPGKGGKAEISGPKPVTIDLAPGTIFPVRHLQDLIARAEAGEKIVSRTVFDGTEEEGAFDINAVIGPRRQPDPKERTLPPSVDGPYWPARLAFFHAKGDTMLPFYEMSVHLMANGIAREFELDYGDSVIRADLERIEILRKPRC